MPSAEVPFNILDRYSQSVNYWFIIKQVPRLVRCVLLWRISKNVVRYYGVSYYKFHHNFPFAVRVVHPANARCPRYAVKHHGRVKLEWATLACSIHRAESGMHNSSTMLFCQGSDSHSYLYISCILHSHKNQALILFSLIDWCVAEIWSVDLICLHITPTGGNVDEQKRFSKLQVALPFIACIMALHMHIDWLNIPRPSHACHDSSEVKTGWALENARFLVSFQC